MAATLWYFGALVLLILVPASNSNSIGNKRLKLLQRKVANLDKVLKNIERRRLGCSNRTLYSVSDRVDEVYEMLSDVYTGPLYTKMDLSWGYRNYDQVLMTLPDAIEKCVNSYRGTYVETYRAEITCLQQILWRYEDPPNPRQMRMYQQIVRRYRPDPIPKTPNRISRNNRITDFKPVPILRIRKEYRTLTEFERERFHNATNKLKENGVIDAFAAVHDSSYSGAHSGPAFLAWHRMFLIRLENALRTVEPGVTLPYWDSSMDDARENPTNSIMWTSKLVGNGAGLVKTGPFKDWWAGGSFLERAYGQSGRLVSKTNIANMLTKCSLQEISKPFAPDDYNLEEFHNQVHVWVGGHMSHPSTAPHDPVFYLHHCYIDYLWEKFREHQRENCPGVDPETNYPNTNQAYHGYNDNMLGLEEHSVADGMSDNWTKNLYRYADTPTCDDNCGGSNLLLCHEMKDCCIPKSRFTGPSDIRALPIPGQSSRIPPDFSRLLRIPPSRCDRYLDPDCLNAYIVAKDRAGLPLQPYEELRIIEQMVPYNRGPRFSSATDEQRSLKTLKRDYEQYEREMREYKAAQAARRRADAARKTDVRIQ